MKGEILFEKMTGISDEYVAEAALVAPVGVESHKRNRFSSLSSALNSGWGVACICFVVAIATVVGMVAWGRMGDDVPTVPPVHQPALRFSFSYDMRSSDGSDWNGTALPGDTVYVDTSVLNQGKSFDTYDFFAHAHFVLQGDDTVTLQGVYPVIDTDKHTVDSGDRGSRCFTFFIPENATPGVYDLVLSFDGEEQFFSGVLTVGEIDTEGETQPPVDTTDRYGFSFGYEPFGGFSTPGGCVTIKTWVINEGSGFVFEGGSNGYAPSAALVHTETGYRVESALPVTGDWVTFTVSEGQKGERTQTFLIPADAPTGAYSLQLSYGGVTKSFAGAVIVADRSVEVPTVLSNLTVAVGSDWLYEPIDEAYVPGELVTVRFKCGADMEPLLILNEAFVEATAGNEQTGYLEYSFYMPDEDSEIYFYTYDRTLPYAAMLESCIAWDHYNFSEKEFYYYGQTEKGVMVALLLGNGEAITRTNVGNYQFITPTTHELMAYYNGGLYRLRIAYEDYELLTEEDLADLFAMHQSLFPDCYVDMPSPK
ncbi:MAG: hypothetical protein IKU90_06415 [Clostridia bacterium]|nr:hypothetical protein [Clostridia bacterium]